MRSHASLLFALVTLSGVSGCADPNATGGSSATSTPDAQAQSEARPARCSGTLPTRFVDGVPASITSSETTTLFVDEVVTDSDLLYWTLLGGQDGRIVTAAVGQGVPVVVVDETGEGSPTHLAMKGGHLSWLEVSASNPALARVMRAATDGWDPRALTGYEAIVAVAFDESAAYLVEGSAIVRVDMETGARQALAVVPEAFAGGIAVDDANAYFVTGSPEQGSTTLRRVPKTGGPVAAISTQSASTGATPAGDVATDGAQIDWSVGGFPSRIFGVPDDGGACASLATTEGTATMLRRQGSWLYFTSWDLPTPAMFRVSPQGGTPSLVVPMFGTAAFPTPGYNGTASRGASALDGTNVYFGGFDGQDAPAVFCVAQ